MIAKLKHRCELSNAQVNAFVADLTTYQFEQNYDMIVCFGTLHYKSYVFEDEHPNVPKHLHASNKIVARKDMVLALCNKGGYEKNGCFATGSI